VPCHPGSLVPWQNCWCWLGHLSNSGRVTGVSIHFCFTQGYGLREITRSPKVPNHDRAVTEFCFTLALILTPVANLVYIMGELYQLEASSPITSSAHQACSDITDAMGFCLC